jgi:hypothetical protein
MVYRLSNLFPENRVSHQIEPQDLSPVQMSGRSSQLKRKRNEDEDEEMALFRRVRIQNSHFLPAKDSRPGSPVSTSSAASVWSDVASQDSKDEEEPLYFSQLAGTNRIKYRPSKGDAVLVEYMKYGKWSDIAQQAGAQPLASGITA